MNKIELLNKADELISKANELKELADNEDVILVPDEIKITKSTSGFSMGIINGQQELYYSYHYKNWEINSSINDEEIIKCKLTPCKYEDLKAGDVFYRSDFEDPDFDVLVKYAIKLKDGHYQYWIDKDCINNADTWEHYWKVEALTY